MTVLSGVGVILALAVLIVLASKGVKPLPMSLLAALIVCIFSGLPIVETLLGSYATACGNFIAKYLILIVSGAIMGRIYQETGAGSVIADFLARIFGEKRILLTLMATIAVMTFAGIASFVIVFALYPVASVMLKKGNISRHVYPAIHCCVCWTAMVNIPGSPQLLNVLPMQYLGTSNVAAWQPGVLTSVSIMVLGYFYLSHEIKKLQAQGIGYEAPEGEIEMDELSGKNRPALIIAFIPIILIAVLCICLGMGAEKAVLITDLVAFLLMCNKLKLADWGRAMSDGIQDSISAVMGTAVIVGFGGVVQASPFYTALINMISTSQMNIYLLAGIASLLIGCMLASASGSSGMVMQTLSEVFINSGANLEWIHRIVSQMCTVGNLPHCGGLIPVYMVCKTDHKHAYKYVFVAAVVIPFICATVFDVIGALIFA